MVETLFYKPCYRSTREKCLGINFQGLKRHLKCFDLQALGMKPVRILFVIWGFLVIFGKAQLPVPTSNQNLYLDNNNFFQSALIEEYLNTLCTAYDGEVYIFLGIDAIPLCQPKTRKDRKLLLFLLLLLPMSKIMVELIDGLTPDPPDPTTPAPTTTPPVPPTPAG
uniref:Uncharacterized protein n=1 Tax=Magallana gigas TaxID=29159 RepID=A0A8W8L0J7_MAGGI